MPALLPTATFTARTLAPPAPASPWSIDAGRTQQLPPATPGASLRPTATFTAREIAPPSPASPWSIDPQRTQQLPPSF